MTRLATVALLLTLAGCRVDGGAEAPPVPEPAAPVAVDTGTVFVPETVGGCTLVAQDSVALYTRPSLASPRFGTLAPGDSAVAAGRAPGFVGIAPGTAQAADAGPFRLRYAAAEAPFALRGNCDALPPQPRLDPTACYQIAMGAVAMHARPDTAAHVVGTIPAQGFAVATRRTPTGWLSVRLGGETGPPGWVAPADVNLSGSECEAL